MLISVISEVAVRSVPPMRRVRMRLPPTAGAPSPSAWPLRTPTCYS